jgi:hypothetical protein
MPTVQTQPDVHGHALQDCIDACSACHEICEQMIFQHCLHVGGKHAGQEHLKLMTDCAQICQVCADFMIRGSRRHDLICRACADICDACAADCERLGDMDDCVAACRQCARSCREMAV